MKNRFYLKVGESKSERLSPYNAYKVYKGYNGLWCYDDDYGYCDGYKTMSEMEDAVRTKENTEAKIIALAPDVFFSDTQDIQTKRLQRIKSMFCV